MRNSSPPPTRLPGPTDALLFRPPPAAVSRRHSRAFAIIAPPYARLGGSCDDAVVRRLARTFLALGLPVVLFNPRPAASFWPWAVDWTGRGAAREYADLIEAGRRELFPGGEVLEEVFCCGYSHGALSALAQTPLPSPTRTSYLLVSPPLFFQWFLAPHLTFSRSSYPALTSLALARADRTRPPFLVVHGSLDSFTPLTTVQAWADPLVEQSMARFVHRDRADHFWRERGDGEFLSEEVEKWVLGGWEGDQEEDQ